MWITKMLIRLQAWSVPLLFANPQRQVFLRRGHIVFCYTIVYIMCFFLCRWCNYSAKRQGISYSSIPLKPYWSCVIRPLDKNVKPKFFVLSSVNNISFKYKEHQGTTDTSYIQYSIFLFHKTNICCGDSIKWLFWAFKANVKNVWEKKYFLYEGC